MTAAGENDGLAGPDIHGFLPLVNIAVLPIALHELTGLGVLPRRIVRRDSQNPAREGVLTHDLVETTVKHELDTLLPCRELQRP